MNSSSYRFLVYRHLPSIHPDCLLFAGWDGNSAIEVMSRYNNKGDYLIEVAARHRQYNKLLGQLVCFYRN